MLRKVFGARSAFSEKKWVWKKRGAQEFTGIPEKAATVTGTILRTTAVTIILCWRMNAIGTQWRDSINSCLTRWRLAV